MFCQVKYAKSQHFSLLKKKASTFIDYNVHSTSINIVETHGRASLLLSRKKPASAMTLGYSLCG